MLIDVNCYMAPFYDLGVTENPLAAIALHKVGMEPKAIFENLHPRGITRMFM